MKKISMLLVVLMSALLLSTPIYAETEQATSGEVVYNELEERKGNASLTTIENLTTKEEKIEHYSKVLGSKTNGTVFYYSSLIQKYSIPVCFIGLTIASLNFFIIGNKKLDKREQGFNMLIFFGAGLIVLQVLPLLFAIVLTGGIGSIPELFK